MKVRAKRERCYSEFKIHFEKGNLVSLKTLKKSFLIGHSQNVNKWPLCNILIATECNLFLIECACFTY